MEKLESNQTAFTKQANFDTSIAMADTQLVSNNFRLSKARTDEDHHDVVALLKEYEAWLDMGLPVLSNFETDVTSLPGEYGLPRGEILLARDMSGAAVGCVAIRALPSKYDAKMKSPDSRSNLESLSGSAEENASVCELKRLFVRPQGRRLGLGQVLLQKALEAARAMGYSGIKLDSLPRLTDAIRMYKRLGFVETRPYHDVLPDLVYFELDLTS